MGQSGTWEAVYLDSNVVTCEFLARWGRTEVEIVDCEGSGRTRGCGWRGPDEVLVGDRRWNVRGVRCGLGAVSMGGEGISIFRDRGVLVRGPEVPCERGVMGSMIGDMWRTRSCRL